MAHTTHIKTVNNICVCTNMHALKSPQAFCSCGASAYSECPSCGKAINGTLTKNRDKDLHKVTPDLCCTNCGTPYPWTKQMLETIEIVLAQEKVPKELRQTICEIVLASQAETLLLPVHATRFRQICQNLKPQIVELLQALVSNIACNAFIVAAFG